MLARDEDGRAYLIGDQLVIERTFAGKRIETRLPMADLEWLWEWSELLRAACDALTVEQMFHR